jgi:hypothetical protein
VNGAEKYEERRKSVKKAAQVQTRLQVREYNRHRRKIMLFQLCRHCAVSAGMKVLECKQQLNHHVIYDLAFRAMHESRLFAKRRRAGGTVLFIYASGAREDAARNKGSNSIVITIFACIYRSAHATRPRRSVDLGVFSACFPTWMSCRLIFKKRTL